MSILLLVEAEVIGVTVWRRGADGGFAIERYDDLAAVIALPEIEAEMPLAELYGNVHAVG